MSCTLLVLNPLLLLPSSGTQADPDIDIEADFSALTGYEVLKDQERYFDLEGDVEFQFEVTDTLDTFLEIEAEIKEIELEELSFRWKIGDRLRLKAGAFENEISLDEYLNDFELFFATGGLLAETLINMGYISNTLSVTVYRNHEEDSPGLPISWLTVLKQIPSTEYTPQVDAGVLYHFAGPDSYTGLFAVFAPYVVTLADSELKYAYLLDAFIANHEKRFIYAAEAVLGTNIVTPASVISHGAYGETSSHFLGTDLYAGYRLFRGRPAWTPLLRWSVLFPETSEPEASQMEVIWGNRLEWSDDMTLNVDLGLQLLSDFFSDSPDSRVEPLVEVLFQVRL